MKNIGSKLVKLFMWVLGPVLIVTSAGLLLSTTREWSSTTAEVTSFTEQYTDSDSPQSYYVSYQYEVEGVQYTGSISTSAEYAPGDTLTIYYDPAIPDVSHESQRGAALTGFITLVFGFFCLGSMLWGAWKGRAAKKTPPPPPTAPQE